MESNQKNCITKPKVYSRGKKALIILLSLLMSIVILIVLGSFSIIAPIRGKIINSVSKDPISGLSIERMIAVRPLIGGPGGPGGGWTKGYLAKTDINGNFSIGLRIIWKVFPISRIGMDALNINSSRINEIGPIQWGELDSLNKGFYPAFHEDVKYFQKNIIEIAPKVDDIAKCKGEQICVENNSLDLALENKEERLCLGLSKDRIYDRFECIKILAIAKKNPSICSLIRTSKPGVDANYEKMECGEMANLNFKLLSDLSEDDALDLSSVCDNEDWLIETRSLCKRSIGDDLYPL